MRFGYNCVRNRFNLSPKQLMVAIGLFAVPITLRLERAASAEPIPPKPALPATPQVSQQAPAPAADARTLRLARFFSRLHCPILNLAEDFVHEADENHLDWRLLPSISVVESGGGKAFKNNNIFGWNNGNKLFPTIRSGIREVAYKLGRSPLYKNRDSVGKLRIYNPDQTYVQNVVTVMNRISPEVNLRPVRRVFRQQEAYAFQQN